MGDDMETAQVYRSDELDRLDAYYEGTAYDDLQDWDAKSDDGEYVPVRERKPRVQYNVAKLVCNKVAAKIVGAACFPTFKVDDDDDDTAFFKEVVKACKLKSALIEPTKRALNAGACFIRYYIVNGSPQIEYAQSKYCYPTFDATGALEACEIKYIFDDQKDKDTKGKPKAKWYRIVLTKTADILYDTPEYRPGVKPTFNEVDTAQHSLGWVQGVWLVTHKDKFDFDGYSLYGDVLDFIDALNYSLSQTDQAVSYNQEPQTIITGVAEEEVDTLIRSSQKAWTLPKDATATHLALETDGITAAVTTREELRNRMFEVIRVVIQDPEKDKAGGVQSGEALKQLNAPLCELVDDLRQMFEPVFIDLILKISLTLLHLNAGGDQTILQTPKGYIPTSFDLTAQWPPIFPVTIADITAMATAANMFQQAGVVSRETLTKWIASATDIIDDVEEELKRIETQEPLPSPFGTFGDEGGGQ
jgi:hypothetical protein